MDIFKAIFELDSFRTLELISVIIVVSIIVLLSLVNFLLDKFNYKFNYYFEGTSKTLILTIKVFTLFVVTVSSSILIFKLKYEITLISPYVAMIIISLITFIFTLFYYNKCFYNSETRDINELS